MRYLITGGAGFIGSHLADALVARGDSVLLFDNLSTGRLDNIQHLIEGEHSGVVEFRSGTVLDYPLVERLVREVDVVVHLAASVGVQLIVRRPLEALLNNVRGTEILLDAASRHGRKVLVASTSEIYGKNAAGPLHEDSRSSHMSTGANRGFRRSWSGCSTARAPGRPERTGWSFLGSCARPSPARI